MFDRFFIAQELVTNCRTRAAGLLFATAAAISIGETDQTPTGCPIAIPDFGFIFAILQQRVFAILRRLLNRPSTPGEERALQKTTLSDPRWAWSVRDMLESKKRFRRMRMSKGTTTGPTSSLIFLKIGDPTLAINNARISRSSSPRKSASCGTVSNSQAVADCSAFRPTK